MRQNRREIALVVLLLCVFALDGAAAALTQWAAVRDCGAALPGIPLYEGIGALVTQNTGFFNPALPCHPPMTAVNTGVIAAVVLVVAVVITGWVLWRNFTESPTYLRLDLLGRRGFAMRREVRMKLGTRVTRRRAKVIRPTVKGAQASDAGWLIGRSRRLLVWISTEASAIIWGSPRSGKTFRIVVNAILGAPGAVVTTSTRPESLIITYKAMVAAGRQVVIFDPDGLTGLPAGKKWSPINYAEDPKVASRHARDIMAAQNSGSNADWATASGIIVARLLHAAAVGKRDVRTLRQWTATPAAAWAAVDDLSSPRAADGWAESLRGTLQGDPKMIDSNWHLLKSAFEPLFQPHIAAAMSPANAGEMFNPVEFLNERGALYLIGTGESASAVGGFLSAMMNDVVEAGRAKAATQKDGRLDPPLALILDEIANLFSWPGLPRVLSDGGGQGISTMVVFQGLAQARSAWTDAEAATIWDSAIVKVLLGGAASFPDLENFSKLLGRRIIKQHSESFGITGPSFSSADHEVPLVHADELRRLPEGLALLQTANVRGVLLDMRGWTKRKGHRAIAAGKRVTEAESLAALTEKYVAAIAASNLVTSTPHTVTEAADV